jgi:hypothetical protein
MYPGPRPLLAPRFRRVARCPVRRVAYSSVAAVSPAAVSLVTRSTFDTSDSSQT